MSRRIVGDKCNYSMYVYMYLYLCTLCIQGVCTRQCTYRVVSVGVVYVRACAARCNVQLHRARTWCNVSIGHANPTCHVPHVCTALTYSLLHHWHRILSSLFWIFFPLLHRTIVTWFMLIFCRNTIRFYYLW